MCSLAGPSKSSLRPGERKRVDRSGTPQDLGAAISKREPISGRPGADPAARPDDDLATATVDSGCSSAGERLPEGCEVGRYRIGRTLGAGGMGVVYEAFDPQLDRRVALKFVNVPPGSSEEQDRARDRTLREAQALALLSHPNVVTVYDAGTMGNAVFIAMEHVEGLTLAEWLARDEPDLNAIIRTYCAAGEGLAAAHRAGLVHRDFKPQNVLLGADGRVRVIDFGIARGADDTFVPAVVVGEADGRVLSTTTNRSGLSSSLTVEGAIVGTPRYMSPEQRERRLADARSDQYSFCLSLYEAIYGKTPQRERSLEDCLLDSGRDGKRPPRWLRKVLLHGLAVDPGDRFASMDALLTELRRDRRAWLTRATLAAAVVVAVGAVTIASLREGPEERCARGSRQARDVWSEQAQSRFRRVLRGAGAQGVDSLYASVDKGLRRFFGAYESSYVHACEATFVRAAQSSTLLDLRMSCLARRRLQVESLIRGAGDGASNKTLQRIPEALAHLTNISHCNDTEALQRVVPKPDDPKLATQIAGLERELDQVEALTLGGKYQDADELAKATFEKAKAVDYAPLRAQTLFRLGYVDDQLGRYDEALVHFRGAALAAATGKDLDLAARALTKTIWSHVRKSELDEGLAISFPTEVLLASQTHNPSLPADYHGTLGILHYRKSQFKEAEARFRKALELRSRAGARDGLDFARLLMNFGPVLVKLGKSDEAKSVLTRAVAMAEAVLGPDNPNLAPYLNNLGFVYDEAGDAQKTAELDARVLHMQRSTLGEKHPMVGVGMLNLGNTLRSLGRWDEAEELLRSALSILQEAFAPDHVDVTQARVVYADIARQKGDYEKALLRYADAIAKMRAHGTAETEYMVDALHGSALASMATGKLELARASVDEGLQLSTKIHGESHKIFTRALSTRSRLALLQGRASEARSDATRVLEPSRAQESEMSSATAHIVLAQLLRQSRPDEARLHADTAAQLLLDGKSHEAKTLRAEAEGIVRALPQPKPQLTAASAENGVP